MQYPNVLFHFDLAGLNLSRAQSGMMKGIQGGRGWPDLFIAEPKNDFAGLFLEIKTVGTKLLKKDSSFTTPHITEQHEMIHSLYDKGYRAAFTIGFDEAKEIIDNYLL
jgi:hypothetical protein